MLRLHREAAQLQPSCPTVADKVFLVQFKLRIVVGELGRVGVQLTAPGAALSGSASGHANGPTGR